MNDVVPSPSSALAHKGKANHPVLAGSVHLVALLLAILTASIAGPAGAVVGLLVWVIIKDKQSLVSRHAAEVFNFNFSMFIYMLASHAIVIFTVPIVWLLGVPLVVVISTYWVMFSALGAIEGFNGRPFHYPLSLRWIKTNRPDPVVVTGVG